MLTRYINLILEPFIAIILLICAVFSRFTPKKIDIGLGPLPLINNIYHKKVFEKCGFTAETFVNQVWHITSKFDVRADTHFLTKIPIIGIRLNTLRFVIWSFFRYRCLVIYFNGGPLGVTSTFFLWRIEPLLFSIANIKTIVLAYGGDVQIMSRTKNLVFKDAQASDYPLHRLNHKKTIEKVDLWTSHGTHIIGGCEWVDYMHHWDTLMISHFSIDLNDWTPTECVNSTNSKTLKVLHAPNHRKIKGTSHILTAIKELQDEGYAIELVLAEKLANHEIKELIKSVDLVIDQLIVGWYAMFAIESMSLGKPVVCNVRKDLEYLYRTVGLLNPNEEIPLIHACPLTIKSVLIDLCERKDELPSIGKRGQIYVQNHHSVEAIAKVFQKIANDILGSPEKKKIES